MIGYVVVKLDENGNKSYWNGREGYHSTFGSITNMYMSLNPSTLRGKITKKQNRIDRENEQWRRIAERQNRLDSYNPFRGPFEGCVVEEIELNVKTTIDWADFNQL